MNAAVRPIDNRILASADDLMAADPDVRAPVRLACAGDRDYDGLEVRVDPGEIAGRRALDAALESLGRPVVEANADFALGDPYGGPAPALVLRHPTAAPFSFLFTGGDVEVWVGPIPEVASFDTAADPSVLENQFRDVLQSQVELSRSRFWWTVVLSIPGSDPWAKLRFRRHGFAAGVRPHYKPYA